MPAKGSTYMIYQEGIYVGYKYYETRYEDYVMGAGNAGDYAYGDIVAYPFGYGLSYTDFKFSDMTVNYNDALDVYTVAVKVTNTGAVAGKRTVQLYVQSPYTDYDKQNGVREGRRRPGRLRQDGRTGPRHLRDRYHERQQARYRQL